MLESFFIYIGQINFFGRDLDFSVCMIRLVEHYSRRRISYLWDKSWLPKCYIILIVGKKSTDKVDHLFPLTKVHLVLDEYH